MIVAFVVCHMRFIVILQDLSIGCVDDMRAVGGKDAVVLKLVSDLGKCSSEFTKKIFESCCRYLLAALDKGRRRRDPVDIHIEIRDDLIRKFLFPHG